MDTAMDSDSDSSDSISVTSTIVSEPASEYNLDRIVAESTDLNGEPRYLAKWEDYPPYRATWEPAESFDAELLAEWRIKSATRTVKEDTAADEIIEEEEEYRIGKESRKRRRERKRARLAHTRPIYDRAAASLQRKKRGSAAVWEIDSHGDEPMSDDPIHRQGSAIISKQKVLRGEFHDKHSVSPKVLESTERKPQKSTSKPQVQSSKSSSGVSQPAPKKTKTLPSKSSDSDKLLETAIPVGPLANTTLLHRARVAKAAAPPTQHTPSNIDKNKKTEGTANSVYSTTATSALPQPRPGTGKAVLAQSTKPAPKSSQPASSINTSTTKPAIKPSGGTGWVRDYTIRDGSFSVARKTTARKSTSTHQLSLAKAPDPPTTSGPDNKPRHVFPPGYKRRERVPNKEALNLKPAAEWATTAPAVVPGISSNIEASRAMATSSMQRESSDTQMPAARVSENAPAQRPLQNDDKGDTLRDHNSLTTRQPLANLPDLTGRKASLPSNENSAKQSRDPPIPLFPSRLIGGRFVAWGEALVHLSVRNGLVGATRFQGFDEKHSLPVLMSILGMKAIDKKTLDLTFAHVLDRTQFKQIFGGRGITTRVIGWVTGYDDSDLALADVIQYLETEGKTAAWSHPEQKVTLFLCSAASQEWVDLRQQLPVRNPNAKLLIIATSFLHLPDELPLPASAPTSNCLPSQSSGQTSATTQDASLTAPHTSTITQKVEDTISAPAVIPSVSDPRVRPRPRPSITVTQPDVRKQTQPSSKILQNVLQSPVETADAASDSGLEIDDSPMERTMTTTNNAGYQKYFYDRYAVNFQAVLGNIKLSEDSSLLCFLHFDNQKNLKERERWKKYLEANHVLSNHIFDSSSSRNWTMWKRTLQSLPKTAGIVVIQENKSYNFADLPGLADEVLDLYHDIKISVNVFSFTPDSSKPSSKSLRPLFPKGGSVLLTERTLVEQPELSLAIITWFRELLKFKEPGSWKLFLRPNICMWLRRMAIGSTDQRLGNLFIDMLFAITKMVPTERTPMHVDITADPAYDPGPGLDGGWTKLGEPVPIICPDSLEGYEDSIPGESDTTRHSRQENILAEFFAGSALRARCSARRFYAITPVVEHIKRKQEWSHVRFLDPKKFCGIHKIKIMTATKATNIGGLKGSPKPTGGLNGSPKRTGGLNENVSTPGDGDTDMTGC